ncbi:MAG: hypothetical protein FWD49_00650 [Firmicutes bacterium]|nr:hypothetical protein [Bacillota bacterium]
MTQWWGIHFNGSRLSWWIPAIFFGLGILLMATASVGGIEGVFKVIIFVGSICLMLPWAFVMWFAKTAFSESIACFVGLLLYAIVIGFLLFVLGATDNNKAIGAVCFIASLAIVISLSTLFWIQV